LPTDGYTFCLAQGAVDVEVEFSRNPCRSVRYPSARATAYREDHGQSEASIGSRRSRPITLRGDSWLVGS
jgi:hypothetical protein